MSGRRRDVGHASERDELLSIGAAAALRASRSELCATTRSSGCITPCGRTPGGLRRYSEEDLARVRRIRELQTLLGLNLDEIAVVLRNDDRLAEIKAVYHDEHTGAEERSGLARECLVLLEQLRGTVETKRAALGRLPHRSGCPYCASLRAPGIVLDAAGTTRRPTVSRTGAGRLT